jgi:hypothetical protein
MLFFDKCGMTLPSGALELLPADSLDGLEWYSVESSDASDDTYSGFSDIVLQLEVVLFECFDIKAVYVNRYPQNESEGKEEQQGKVHHDYPIYTHGFKLK